MQREAAGRVVQQMVEASYPDNYQPEYEDKIALHDAIHELHITDAVTTPRDVDAVTHKLSQLVEGGQQGPLLIIGNCNESVEAKTPIATLRERMQSLLGVVACSTVGDNALTVLRGFGQSNKPRSKQHETLADGSRVESYMGDMVNGRAEHDRSPDPTRMVATALQARDVAADLTTALGNHVPAAHETLLLPYEESFIRTDLKTGKDYLLSADIPWIGLRTNTPEGEHVKLLARVENPVGIKIGAGTTAEHIKQLSTILNPDAAPGKLILMLRLGLDKHAELPELLEAIGAHARGSVLMYDIHGATKTRADGAKLRLVDDIVEEITLLSQACETAGLRLHGLHLEAMSDDARNECADTPDQNLDDGNIDPQLNPRQLAYVLDNTAHCFA